MSQNCPWISPHIYPSQSRSFRKHLLESEGSNQARSGKTQRRRAAPLWETKRKENQPPLPIPIGYHSHRSSIEQNTHRHGRIDDLNVSLLNEDFACFDAELLDLFLGYGLAADELLNLPAVAAAPFNQPKGERGDINRSKMEPSRKKKEVVVVVVGLGSGSGQTSTAKITRRSEGERILHPSSYTIQSQNP